jgi:hypothetical protein
MANFTTIAAAIALGMAYAPQSVLPLGSFRLGRVVYEVRAVNDGDGLGGFPARCADPAKDYVMVVYTARNNGDDPITAPALQRLVLIDPEGRVVRPDPALTRDLARRISPPLDLVHGALPDHGSAVLADVFVTDKGAAEQGAWRVRAADPISTSTGLQTPKRADSEECF